MPRPSRLCARMTMTTTHAHKLMHAGARARGASLPSPLTVRVRLAFNGRPRAASTMMSRSWPPAVCRASCSVSFRCAFRSHARCIGCLSVGKRSCVRVRMRAGPFMPAVRQHHGCAGGRLVIEPPT